MIYERSRGQGPVVKREQIITRHDETLLRSAAAAHFCFSFGEKPPVILEVADLQPGSEERYTAPRIAETHTTLPIWHSRKRSYQREQQRGL